MGGLIHHGGKGGKKNAMKKQTGLEKETREQVNKGLNKKTKGGTRSSTALVGKEIFGKSEESLVFEKGGAACTKKTAA